MQLQNDFGSIMRISACSFTALSSYAQEGAIKQFLSFEATLFIKKRANGKYIHIYFCKMNCSYISKILSLQTNLFQNPEFPELSPLVCTFIYGLRKENWF